jgi:ferredoxin
MRPNIKHEMHAATYWVKIFISGPIDIAKQTCRTACLAEGLCVTVDPTTYIYTGGEEAGVVVGLIQYPRFVKSEMDIWRRAVDLAMDLLGDMKQHSVLVQDPTTSVWYTLRENT